jgi:anthranilate 1,2-dioxygenase small subunit/terephthalate 1,2-dioxygenase oxygenase component beta subunit
MDDLLAVARLQADYAHCIDSDALEGWPDFFTADGLYRITNAHNERQGLPIGIVHCAGQAMMRDRIVALREANVYEAQRYRHLLSLPRLLGDGRVVTGFMVARIMHTGETDLFATGEYRDVIVRDGDTFKFKERVVVLDSERVDTLLAIPI